MRTLDLQLTRESGLTAAFLRCPVCSCDGVHPLRVEVLEIDGTKTSITPGNIEHTRETPPDRRGVRFEVRCRCERGHTFDLAHQFHEGRIYIEAVHHDHSEIPTFERT